jgi:2-phosphosulfolactate phosphatase
MKITVYFEPKDAKPTILQNATVVLADVLRATTTIPVFLYHGAAGVVLCPDPGSAKKAFEKLKRGTGLLAGERDWGKIPGFHLGGSPLQSSRDKVKGRTICFSTPSALRLPKAAKHVILGSFVNLGDVYDSCLRGKRDVVVVCAGGDEDSAFAGMLVDFLQSTLGPSPVLLTESAKEAMALYKPWQGRLSELLRGTDQGQALAKSGNGKDLDLCAKLNRIPSVPYLKDGVFLREDSPRPRKLLETGKPKSPSAPLKGKSIKVTVPHFPKNPEHPVPGMEKGGKKGAASHAPEPKKADDKKGGDKKGAKVPAKPEGKPAGPKPKKAPAPPKPMFSKKTVVGKPVKVPKRAK